MDFQDVIRRRRMIRTYDLSRPVRRETIQRLFDNAIRAPSAGFSQGWGFLVLNEQDDIDRFRQAVTPAQDADGWLAANVAAPLIIVPMSNRSVYVDRYAKAEKGHTDPDTSWWPAPYWDIDTGMAAMSMLLTAVDEGLGACFFGIPKPTYPPFRAAFGVPEAFTPIGAISFGYSDEPARDLRARRRRIEDVVHWRRWAD